MNNLELVSKLAKPSCRRSMHLNCAIVGDPTFPMNRLVASAEKLLSAKTRLAVRSLGWSSSGSSLDVRLFALNGSCRALGVPQQALAPLVEHQNWDCPLLHMRWRVRGSERKAECSSWRHEARIRRSSHAANWGLQSEVQTEHHRTMRNERWRMRRIKRWANTMAGLLESDMRHN